MRHIWSVAAVLLLACGRVDDAPDAGVDASVGGPVAALDAGPICEADRHCDTGLFCEVRRCIPGSPEADPRGCVSMGDPCDGPCDEERRRCGEPCRDLDGDGHEDETCGGDDCDDGDPLRYAGRAEICDLMNHDEDCDPTTVGPDDDGDGESSEACCNGLSCGTDCDDTDPGIYSRAMESCDAIDNNCDGTADEGFECVQNAAVPGTTACGTEGVRRCSADCLWLDAEYYVAESSSTCNYCSDSGMGLASERSFATSTYSGMLDSSNLHGTAAEAMVFTGRFTFFNAAGAIVSPAAETVGYGTFELEAEIQFLGASSSPQYGWALVIIEDPAASVAGTAVQYGVPRGVDGVSLEWTWQGSSADVMWLRHLAVAGTGSPLPGPAGNGRPSPSLNNGTDPVTQTMRMVITPDDPDTAQNETAVVGGFVNTSGFQPQVRCGPLETTPCGARISTAESVWFAVTAGSTTTSGGAVENSAYLTSSRILIRNRCP